MQLAKQYKGKICSALSLFAASLFTTPAAQAQEPPQSPGTFSDKIYFGDEAATAPDIAHLDSAVLFYRESGSRVQVIEPAANLTWTGDRGQVLAIELVVDTITGASPNGMVPLNQPQTLISLTKTGSGAVSTTGASSYGGYYMVAANTLPVNRFQDRRIALNVSYSTPIDSMTRVSLGGSGSRENDYSSISGNLGVSRDFNHKNTTLDLGLSYEADVSSPYFGIPVPLATTINAGQRRKTVVGVLLGLSQVMNRHWLAQISYNYGRSLGYQTDPYREISIIDNTLTVTPGPSGCFEGRPETRIRQSIYIGNKIAVGHAAVDISARLYHDSWGITSGTFDVSDRVPLNSWMYLEPHFRLYAQSKAYFFAHYLIKGQPLPAYASSDSRLGQFTATTFGLKAGFKMGNTGELYLRAESYRQHGDEHPAGVVPALARQNLFSGVRAVTVIMGLAFDF